MSALEEYRNERLFSAQIVGEYDGRQMKTQLVRFFFLKPRNCEFKIAEISMVHRSTNGKWIPMKPDQQEKDVNIFVAKMDTNLIYSKGSIIFHVKIVNTTENYGFVDGTWITDLWSENQLADVDVFVGQNKLLAHRVVLSARSPVFKSVFSKMSNTGKSKLTFCADEVDLSVVEHFLRYLYTGTLSISANNKQLLALAEMYQVETLKKICQLAVRVSDVDDITTYFLAFI